MRSAPESTAEPVSSDTDRVGEGGPPVPAAAQRSLRRPGLVRALLRRPTSVIALIWLVAVTVLTIGAGVIAPYGASAEDLTNTLGGPSAAHLLGTDNLGRDILSRLIFGGRVTLLGVLIATVTALVLGSTIGLLAGYLRPAIDSVLSAGADILMSIPVLVILLSVAAVTSRNTTVLMLTVGILFSASVFRVFRAATLEIRQELFITAARTSGLSDLAILRRHVLPRLGSLLIIQGAIAASVTLVIQVGLGFLSIDARPPSPSWGNMVASASQTISTTIWPLIPPAVVIGLTVLAFSAISDVAQQARTGRGRPVGLGGSLKLVALPSAAAVSDERDNGATQPESGAQPLLSINDLTVSVPTPDATRLTLVQGISLAVAPGEIVGLVGESGAGKSITARTILGIVAQGAEVSGSIRYKGTELLGLPEKQLAKFRGHEIAFVGQDPAVSLSPSYRIGRQITEIVRLHRGVSRNEAEAIALDLLDQVRISDPKTAARLYPHQVSGGMAQRVVIALALAGNPKMLIADEPTTALDVSVQMQILGLLKGLQKDRSLAMLIVTHDWGVVADVCDRAIVMYAGQVVEEAPVADIFERPLHPYSSALRSADPHLQTVGDKLRVIEGQVPAPGTWPAGCRFAERCSFATDRCRSTAVQLDAYGEGRLVRCIRVNELGLAGVNNG